jgi:hypothetical protein
MIHDMGRRGVAVLLVIVLLTAGCARSVEGRAAAAPTVPVTVAQLERDPCAALYPYQVRALGLDPPTGAVVHSVNPFAEPGDSAGFDSCRWRAPDLTVELSAAAGQTLEHLRGSGLYSAMTFAGRPILASQAGTLCMVFMQARDGTILTNSDADSDGTKPCLPAIRVSEQALRTVANRPPAPGAALDLDALGTDPCSAGERIPVPLLVGAVPVIGSMRLDTGDLACRWLGIRSGMTFVVVDGATSAAPPGSYPTMIGDRAGSEVDRGGSCSVVVFDTGRSLQITVLTEGGAPGGDCDAAHLAMESLLAG